MRTPYITHVFGDAVDQKLRSQMGWFTGAVASSIPWPAKDVWIHYAGDDFILRGTENGEQRLAPAITMPGVTQRRDECLSKLYRFTSVLGWFREGFVDIVDVVHGSRAIVFGAGTRLAHSSVGQFGSKSFDCNHMPIIEDENVRIALAFWREGERLSGVHDSYAFLSYFKVVESQYQGGRGRADWFTRNLDHLADGRAVTRIAELRAEGEDVGRHLYDSGRNAVAHASFGGAIVDPDIPSDRRRIAADLILMRELARRYIAEELNVPTAMSLYASRNRLEPWESLIDPQALATLKTGGTPDPVLLGLEGLRVGLRLWPDGPLPGLDAMTMSVDAVHEGTARMLLLNDRMTMMFAFVLDYRNGHIHTQLDNSSLLQNDEHRPDEQDVRAFYTVIHRVIGNAVVELLLEGREPIDCEVVIPMNIIPRNPDEAVEEAVEAFRRQQE
ncbi:methylamine utilization protein MauJ [Xanthomonas arboricola]